MQIFNIFNLLFDFRWRGNGEKRKSSFYENFDFYRTFAKPVNSSYPRKRVSNLFSGLLDSRLRGYDGKQKSRFYENFDF